MSPVISNIRRFGEFSIDMDEQVLLHAGVPVPLPPKVFATLSILIENSGRIVAKEDLMNGVWPDTFVEESNLTYNIQRLRKTLNDDARSPRFIETVPRRGYRFIANIEEAAVPQIEIVPPLVAEAAGLNGGDPSIRVREPVPELSFFSHLNRRSVALLAVLVIAFVGAGPVLWRMSRNSRQAAAAETTPSPLNVERLTSTGDSFTPAISPDGKYIAYSRVIERKYSIWLRQLATGTSLQIATWDLPVVGLTFSHGGENLYFVQGGVETALYRISLLGGVPVKVVDGLTGRPAISDDDQKLAFVRPAADASGTTVYSLLLANTDGTDERVLLTRPYPDRFDTPVWLPDSSAIICSFGTAAGEDRSIRLVEIDASNGTLSEMGGDGFAHINSMAWMHGGGLLVAGRRGQNEDTRLWHIAYPTMEARQVSGRDITYAGISVTANGDRVLAGVITSVSDLWTSTNRDQHNLKKIVAAIDNFDWTPDGHIIYSSMAGGGRDVWSMSPDGTGQKQLTSSNATDGNPSVTRDGSNIVFISTAGGSLQIWKMKADGTGQARLTDGEPKNFPAVSADGKWILFNATNDWNVWKMPFDGGAAVRVTDFVCQFPSVSPAGDLIACLGGSPESQILILPFNGGTPIKKFQLAGQRFAGTRLQWSPDGASLVYAADDNGISNLIKQPLNGGRTEQLASFEDDLFDFGFSPDGQKLAVTRGEWQHDVVLIHDVDKIVH